VTIVADTGAVLALLDADDRHHAALADLFRAAPRRWVLPWAILPEVDYLAATRLGRRTADAFLGDLASGVFQVEWGKEGDLAAAEVLARRHRRLGLGLVDAAVMATAERLRAPAIATLDLRHFAAVRLAHRPRLLPRDPAP
jgi:predicted nucleic acid-binding protein